MAKDRVRNKKRKAGEDPPRPEQQQQSEDEYEDPQQKRFIKLKKGWALMEEGIAKLKKILQGSPEPFNSTEYMQLYTTIYNMCTQRPPYDYSEQLYKKYKEALVSYINTAVVPSLAAKHGEFLLRDMVLRWRNHVVMVKWLSRFFSYIDRYYVTRRALQPLQPVGLVCFRDNVYDKIKSQVSKIFISLVEKEREGDQIDRGLMKNLVDVVVAMNTQERDLYVEFEEEFLNDSEGYYSRQASSWIVEETCPDYMFKAEECLKKEKERVENYLQPGTEDKLLGIVQNELLVVYTSQLIEKEGSGCKVLLRDNKDEDLSRMYRLFNKIPKGLESVANIVKHHVTAEGNALIKQAEEGGTSQEKAFVKKVIDLHDTYTRYTTDCFASNLLFYKAIKEAFEAFCNKNVAGSTSGELLASFLDDILKSDKLSDEEVEEVVDKVVKLLDYVSEKDIFAEFHRKKLARRLLFDKSANDGHERASLIKLKKQLGGHCTSKMEGMITDLVLGRENQSEFSEYLGWNEEAKPGIDLSVTVLTTGCWPTYKSSEMNLPEEMAKSVQVFKEFYQLKTKSRKLTWIYSLGNCQVNGKFEQKTIEIGVGAYQAAALLLFNHSDKLSYSEIKTQLNLADEHLNRALHSLSCGKYKILIKEPNSKIVTAKDTFTYNSKFTDRMRRIKVPLPPAVDERKKVVEDVDKERRYAIDACIVRIMKSRKVLGHQLLVTECVEQLSKSFKPDFKVIKRRIEHLISQEYLERDNENPNLFRYLA